MPTLGGAARTAAPRAKHENSTAKVAKAEKMRNAKKWKEMDELLFGGPKFKGQAKKDGR